MKTPNIALNKRGKSGVWFVRYRFNGKRLHYSLGTGDEQAALKMVERIRYELDNSIHRPHQHMVFDNLLTEYLEWAKNHKADSSYLRDRLSGKYLLHFFIGRRIDQLVLKDGERYQQLRLDGKLNINGISQKHVYSRVSINREARLLISMFNKAIAWGLIEQNPFRFLKMFKEEPRERFVKAEEWPILLSASKPALRVIIIFARFTGLRLSEILNVQRKDIDWDLNQITVTKCKNNTPRIVPVNPWLRTLLEKLLKSLTGDYIFAADRLDRDSWVKHGFMKACKKAGIINLRFHDLRHTFASDMINEGVDIATLMKLMGHKTIQTTLRYAHLYPRLIHEAINRVYKNQRHPGPDWDQNSDNQSPPQETNE